MGINLDLFSSLHEYLIVRPLIAKGPYLLCLMKKNSLTLSIQGTLTTRKRYSGAALPLDNRYQGKVLYICSLLTIDAIYVDMSGMI